MPNEGPRFRTLQDYKQHYGGLQELDCGAGGDCFYYCCAAAQNALIWQGFGDCEEPKKAAMMHVGGVRGPEWQSPCYSHMDASRKTASNVVVT